MKIRPTLALATCSIGLLSAASTASVPQGWSFASSVPAQGSPVQQSSGGGTGSANNGGIVTLGPNSSITVNINATANASGSGNGYQSSSADYEITNVITYKWYSPGTPDAVFYVNATPSATASCTYSDGSNCRWTAIGGASTNPNSLTADVTQGYGQNPPGPTSSNPGSVKHQFSPNGASSTSWTVNATAKASGAVLFATGSYTSAATASVKLDPATPN